jgi:transposase, IS30 family
MKNNNKTKGFTHLNLNERIQIEIKHNIGWSLNNIAKHLGSGRNRSTISRELGGRPRKGPGKYEAYRAHCQAIEREKNRGKRLRLKNEVIRTYTKTKLKLGWSPEQISLRISIDLGKNYEISFEAIYQYIYAQIYRGGNGLVKPDYEDLRKYLARRHNRRQKKGFRRARRLEKPLLPSIEDRSAEVEKRKIVGHFEGDTIVSRESKGRLKTLNERVTGVVLIGKMVDGTTEEANRVTIERLNEIPSRYRKTLTQDRGSENTNYQDLEKNLNISCYFAHAYCSQERGSNENTNGLIRRYFPKGTDFSKVSLEEIKHVEYLLNTRPRKRFAGLTPSEVLYIKTGVALKY